ncbi:FERM and PDZ domain-containing protein 2 [Echeneis naucrates]|uniref:FERM and PDZ domain-containing protein 2 n=1 Tax=Echeneis naucrates TaxID=173247 RepID=UPI0011139DBF|nr:FERM and PDZ domain-containing protein 2 [Echeneis naucrates]
MGTFVTLAEVLEARGSPLDEDEVWCLLLATTEALLDISKKGSGSMCSVLSPGSVLLSANGSLAFKSCARFEDVASFTAPEVQQTHAASTRTPAEKMVVYSLGMTLYWCVDYHLPHNQPVHLSAELEGLLLSMCEDVVVGRTDLLTVLETCELHHKAAMLPPPERLVKQLVEDVYKNSVDHVSMAENGSQLTDRSQMVRDRLHRGSFSYSSWALRKKISRTFSGASYPSEPTGICPGGRHRDSYASWQPLNRSPCSPYIDGNRSSNLRSLAQFQSTMSLNDKKVKDMGPEFVRMLEEPQVILELPGSIVSKKGKSPTTQRELSVVMPNGQTILLKCEVKSRGGDIFDMIVAHSNLMEHFYFGLAYIDDNEFFFVDNDTKISKVAPDTWKKVPTATFVLYFRVKFFVKDISLILQKQTRHQFYLQLRRDLLEDRLSCHEETALYLGALALQTEYGDCMPEVCGRNYFRPDQYVPKSVMEKRALPCIQEELLRLLTNNAQMLTEESELEFLKVCQQLPEYGVLFHRVMREKKPLEGEIILGVCAKGVIIYEVKDGCRSTSQTLYWKETATISSNRRKFVVESRGSKKKYTFITERSKIAKYLCDLCSAQHKFNNEMNSRQLSHSLVSEANIVQYAAMCRAQSGQLKSLSCSETPQDNSGLNTPQDESLNKLCDDIAARIEARVKQQRQSLNEQSTCSSSQRSSTGMRSPAFSQKSGSEAPSGSPAAGETPTKTASSAEREVICVSLKKDPKFGLGIVIVGEDTVGRYDLGIFVASIVPGGPADKDGRIRPGGRLISLNHISLEGVTFSEAAEVMQNSPEEVQLIISQPKVSLSPNSVCSPVPRNHESQNMLMAYTQSGDDNLDDVVSVMMTPKTGNRLHVPSEVRGLSAQDNCSPTSPTPCVRPEEITVELRKIAGSLGIGITGGVNTNLPNGGIYIKSLVPGGAAERDGRVHSGDRLLEVDGISFQRFTYQQAVECLSKTGEVVNFVVERELMNLPRVSLSTDSSSVYNQSLSAAAASCSSLSTRPNTSSERPRDYSFVTDDNTQEVTLTKGANGLGFSFLMCELDPPTRDFGSLVRIKQLFSGQPAEQSGRIQEGDVLLAVNGQSLKELSYPKVLRLFKTSPPEVRLTLYRPAPGVLPSIDQLTGT